jgi:heterotetrameric sarcosine oxidase delta subunit
MRLNCPLCGPRDRREFFYYGSEDYLNRPKEGAPEAAWEDHLHLRTNPAGLTKDLWYHEAGCTSWLLVTRDTVTHAIASVERVAGRKASQTKAGAK